MEQGLEHIFIISKSFGFFNKADFEWYFCKYLGRSPNTSIFFSNTVNSRYNLPLIQRTARYNEPIQKSRFFSYLKQAMRKSYLK